MTQECIALRCSHPSLSSFSAGTNIHSPFPQLTSLPLRKCSHAHKLTSSQARLVVVILIRRPPPHKQRLAPSRIDILIQHLPTRIRELHLLGLSDLGIDRRAGLLVDLLELLLSRDVPLEQLVFQAGDGVLRGAHALDLLTRAVRGAWIGHRVPAVAVGDVFQNQGAEAGDCVGFGRGDGGFDGEDIHAVYLEAWDVLPALVVVCQG
jgi:hypothetical protein